MTNETKHTPGPWVASCMDTYGGTDWTKNGGRIRGRNSEGQEVAIAHIYSEPQAEANAMLIAAAPALEQACKDARAWGIELASLLPDERELRFRQLWPKINDVLRDAIAKATP